MRQRRPRRRHPFGVLVFSLILAQAAADGLFWRVSGWPTAWLAFFTAASVVVPAFFAGLAVAAIAPARKVRQEGLRYMVILLASFLCTVFEAIAIWLSVSGMQEGSHQSHETRGTVVLAIAAALLLIACFLEAARRVSDARSTSYLLEILSRLWGQPVAPGFGALDGEFNAEDIHKAVQSGYPDDESGDFERTRLAEDLDRGTALGEGLLATISRNRPQEGVPEPVITAVGFVRMRGGDAKLVVINYFLAKRFFRALRKMPREIGFAGLKFAVIARPWLPVERTLGIAGDGHCWVTRGKDPERYGVVTTNHAIIQQSSRTESDADASTRTSRTRLAGTLRETSDIMQAALIELNDRPRPGLVRAPHTKVAAFRPIRLCIGREQVDGFITGLSECSRGGFRETDPEKEPAAPAFVFFNVVGQAGDSGSLVLDLKEQRDGGPAPYLMYLDVNQLASAQEGYGILLEQVAHHWQINTLFNLESGYNSIDGIIESDE